MSTSQFHPSTWIDAQRQAGDARVNVFDQILAAAKSIRAGQTAKADYRAEQRPKRVHAIRVSAAEHDAEISPRSQEAQSFAQMVQRWKGLP
jgi:hypothetical protein